MDIKKAKKVAVYSALAAIVLGALLTWFIKPDEFDGDTLELIKPLKITEAKAPKKVLVSTLIEELPYVPEPTVTISKVPKTLVGSRDNEPFVETTPVVDENDNIPAKEEQATPTQSHYDLMRALSKAIELQKLLNQKAELLAQATAEVIETKHLQLSLKVAQRQAEQILNPPPPKPVQKKKVAKKATEAKKATKAVKKKSAPVEKYASVKLLALFPSDSTAVVMINGTEHTVHEGEYESLLITIQWRAHTITIHEHGTTRVIKLNTERVEKQPREDVHKHD